jgi:hypothetical protein
MASPIWPRWNPSARSDPWLDRPLSSLPLVLPCSTPTPPSPLTIAFAQLWRRSPPPSVANGPALTDLHRHPGRFARRLLECLLQSLPVVRVLAPWHRRSSALLWLPHSGAVVQASWRPRLAHAGQAWCGWCCGAPVPPPHHPQARAIRRHSAPASRWPPSGVATLHCWSAPIDAGRMAVQVCNPDVASTAYPTMS